MMSTCPLIMLLIMFPQHSLDPMFSNLKTFYFDIMTIYFINIIENVICKIFSTFTWPYVLMF